MYKNNDIFLNKKNSVLNVYFNVLLTAFIKNCNFILYFCTYPTINRYIIITFAVRIRFVFDTIKYVSEIAAI